METQEDREKRIEGYVEAVEYFIKHPEAPLHPVLKAIVESIKKELEKAQSAANNQKTLN